MQSRLRPTRAVLALATALAAASMSFAGTPASYIGPNGNWNVAANWSTNPLVPLNTATTSYDVTISGEGVDYNVAGSNAIDSLSLSGYLDLNTGDNLSVLNGLTMAAGMVYTQNAAFSVGGAVSADSASFYVYAGGSISLPGLTTYNTGTDSGYFTASGAGSQLLLPNLSAVTTANGNAFSAEAWWGTSLELNALTSLSGTGSVLFQAGESGSLRANGLTSLTMNGARIMLDALSGGYLEMTSVASVNNTGNIAGIFDAYADGAGTKMNLPALATIALHGATDTLRATAGADLEVPQLALVTNTGASFETLNLQATGAGSLLNAPLLGSTPLQRINVTVQTGGTILWGQPTSVTGSSITLDTSGTLDTSKLITIDSTNLTATNGATLSIPVASFSATSLGSATWQATNAGSVLLLPNLTTITLVGKDLTVSAANGGDVEMTACTTIVPGTNTLHLTTSGTGSVINLPQVPSTQSRLSVSMTGGTVLWGTPTSLRDSSVTINSSGSINLADMTDIASTSFTASGGATISLGAVTTYATAGSSVATMTANAGSSITFPLLGSTANPGGTRFGAFNVTAIGAGAQVNLPALASISLGGQSDSISASSGGDVELPALAGVTNSSSHAAQLNLSVSGAGSVINVPLLGPEPIANVAVSLQGGTITWGNPTVMQASSVTVNTSGSITLSQLTNIDSTSVNAAGGATITLPNVTGYGTVGSTGATLQASGTNSTFSLPALTSVTSLPKGFGNLTILASGSGSTTLLNALQTVTTNGATITFQAANGGTLQASALAVFSSQGGGFGSLNGYADGSGAKLLLTGLTTLQLDSITNNLRASAGGDLEMPALANVTTIGAIGSLSIQSTGTGSLVNLAGLHPAASLNEALYLSRNGEVDLGGVTAPCQITFSANFAAGSTGTLDVYFNQLLLASITPGNFGNNVPYLLIANTPQAGTPAVRWVANGANASVIVTNFGEATVFIWSSATGASWDTSPTGLDWNGASAWSNNANLSTPNAAIFNLATAASVSVNDNIDVGSITFITGSWIVNSGIGALAYGGTGAISIVSTTGTDTINAAIADGSTFSPSGGVTSLIKSGGGTLILGGANTYSGSTTINDGTLLVNNTSGSGRVTLNGGTLGGYGTIAGAVFAGAGPHTIYPSATLAASSTGTLTVASLSTGANTILAFNLVTPNTTGGSDQINIIGAKSLTLNGGTIQVANTSTGAASLGYYKILQYSGTIQGLGPASLILPAVQNSIAYTLDTTHDPGFIDLHRGLLGDANDDGVTNFSDFILLADHFGQTNTGWGGADFNNDGITNFSDFVLLSNNFGGTIGANDVASNAGPVSGVPEPASLLVVGAGLLGILSARRSAYVRRAVRLGP